MNKARKNISKWLGMMLAVAMVFSLNLTSMTAKAATSIPQPKAQTEVTAPAGVAVTIGGQEAKFYQDTYKETYDDGGLTFIRTEFANKTELDDLSSVEVKITGDAVATKDTDVKFTNNSGVYSANLDLRNKAYTITIGTGENAKDYILAANIKAGTSVPTNDGYVVSAKINKIDAAITRFVNDDPCAGNPYYTQDKDNLIDWISITNYIQKDNVEKPTDTKATPLTYTLKNGTTGTATVDLSKGTAKVTIGKYVYTVKASFVASDVFVASPSTFWIDFQELRNSKDADETALAQAQEIEDAVSMYYEDEDTQKEFPVGTTNMKVLQTILQWCVDNGLISTDTTLGESTTYVAEINGLGEFSVGSLSGWMYTDNPDSSIKPEKWYTAPIGAASYQLAADSKIAWFYAVDYTTHPW